MMWIFITLLFSLLFMIIEIPLLIKKQYYKEIWVFLSILVFSASLSIAKSLNASLPNPFDLLEYIYKPLSDLIFNTLQ